MISQYLANNKDNRKNKLYSSCVPVIFYKGFHFQFSRASRMFYTVFFLSIAFIKLVRKFHYAFARLRFLQLIEIKAFSFLNF